MVLKTQKAVDISVPEALNILLYGDVGTGKTTFATTFPKPLLFFDFDLRHENYAGVEGIEYITYKDERESRPQAYKAFRKDLRELQRENPYKTVVLDSTTTLFDAIANDIMGGIGKSSNEANEGLTQAEWGKLQNRMGEIFMIIKSFNCHTIVISHERMVKDEIDGSVKVLTMNCGRSFPQKAPGYFDEVYRCYRDVGRDGVDYMLQTQSDRKYMARTSINIRNQEGEIERSVLDPDEPQDFKVIWDKIQKARGG